MPLLLLKNDITKVKADVIVNAANSSLLGGGGVDGCIHRAAGGQLLKECRGLGGCKVGEAKATGAYRLPAKWAVHTVGPVWRGGDHGEPIQLAACYQNSLKLAAELGADSVAFPLISAGAYGYPAGEALQVATRTICAFLEQRELTVYLVLYNGVTDPHGSALYQGVVRYLDERLTENDRGMSESRPFAQSKAPSEMEEAAPLPRSSRQNRSDEDKYGALFAAEEPRCCAPLPLREVQDHDAALKKLLQERDESFTEMLLRKIDESGMSDAACYKRANVDRKLFSKIRSDYGYRPSKATALAFAVALHLSLPETKELLRKAGFALSHSSRFDLIVEYFLENGVYDVFTINEALFAFDQALLS